MGVAAAFRPGTSWSARPTLPSPACAAAPASAGGLVVFGSSRRANMGLSITIEVERKSRLFPLDGTELAAIETTAKGEHALRTAYETLFGSNGKARRLPVSTLLDAIDVISRPGVSGLRVPTYWIVSSLLPGR